MTVRVHKRLGHYNLMRPSEQQWLLEIAGLPDDAPARAVSAMFDEDEEPMEDEGNSPADVAETIADAIERPIISTGRERDRAVIEWIRQNESRVNAEWAANRVLALERRRDRLTEEIESLHCLVEAGQRATA